MLEQARSPGTIADPTSSGAAFIEMPEVIAAFRSRPWVVAACSLGCAFLAYIAATRLRPIYQGTAQVVIEPVLPRVLGERFEVENPGQAAVSAASEAVFYNTQYDIMRSSPVLREVVERLKLVDDARFLEAYAIQSTDRTAKAAAAEGVLVRRVEISPERNSRIVAVVVKDFDPDRAARIANEVCQVYMDRSLQERLSTTRNASQWLDQRVEDFGMRMEESEKSLVDFKRDNMLVSVSLEDQKNMTGAELSSLNAKLIEVEAQLLELEAERQAIDRASRENLDALIAVPRVWKNPVVAELKKQLAVLDARRAELEGDKGKLHPDMISLENQIRVAGSHLKEEADLTLAVLDNEIAGRKRARAGFLSAMAAAKERAMSLNNVALDYNKLNRNVGTTKKMYETLVTRQTETSLSGLLESNFVRWLQPAEPVVTHVWPSVPIFTLLGGVAGLLLGAGILVAGVMLDNTIHGQVDVEERLKVAMLGILPSIVTSERKNAKVEPAFAKNRDLYVLANPSSGVAECVRSIRTNLLFLGTEKPLERLLITSAGPSEGKSTAAISLGTTMALAGNRVLLIDTDLRRPRLHKTFGIPSEQGLTSVLLGSVELSEGIKSTEIPELDILPCGPLPPNPSELLHTQRFRDLLARVSQQYDRVLLDSPPVNAVTDALILSQYVDGAIVVVKDSATTKDAARRAVRQLLAVNANILGAILNQADLDRRGYANHYYYGYRAGYGYGTDTKKEAQA